MARHERGEESGAKVSAPIPEFIRDRSIVLAMTGTPLRGSCCLARARRRYWRLVRAYVAMGMALGIAVGMVLGAASKVCQ
jgi:hypothetical protein